MAPSSKRIAGWQYLLAHVDTAVGITGEWDEVTEQATVEWQRAAGLPATGRLDKATWAAAGAALGRIEAKAPENRPVLSIGDEGQDVRDAQRALVRAGQIVTIDGRFSPRMRRAVRSVQAAAGRTESGVIDAETWELLL